MSSLQEHLDRHDRADAKLAVRRDCPVCRGERVLGQLPSTSLVPPRACAAVTALALVTSTVAPGTVLADRQGVAVPAPPSPPPPPANVQAAGGGAAPADADSAPAERPAASAHDNDAPARHEGLPTEGTPAPPPSPASGNEAVDGVTGSAGPSVAHAATGGDTTANDPPAASADHRTNTGSGSGDAATGSPPPAHSGDPAAAAAPAPPPAASAPTPAPSQVATGPAAATAPSRASHRPARRRTTEHPHAAAAPVRPHGTSPATSTSGTEPPHARTAHRGTASSAGTARVGPTGAVKPQPAAAQPSSSETHQHADIETPSTYRVQPGDSLWRIAARHLGPDATTAQTAREVNRLWELNQQRIGTGNPDLIFPGQTLSM
jgi:resuscitation-promoting factor RpfA